MLCWNRSNIFGESWGKTVQLSTRLHHTHVRCGNFTGSIFRLNRQAAEQPQWHWVRNSETIWYFFIDLKPIRLFLFSVELWRQAKYFYHSKKTISFRWIERKHTHWRTSLGHAAAFWGSLWASQCLASLNSFTFFHCDYAARLPWKRRSKKRLYCGRNGTIMTLIVMTCVLNHFECI